MKNFYLNFELDSENTKVYEFMDSILEYESQFISVTNEGLIKQEFGYIIGTIYINCLGGQNILASILYHFLNERKNNYRFVINGMFSSNTLLIFGALNPKEIQIMRQSNSTVHLSSFQLPMREMIFPDKTHPSFNYNNYFETYSQMLLDLYKTFLTKEELKWVKMGGDVDLNPERIKELFDKLKESKSLQNKFKKIFELTC